MNVLLRATIVAFFTTICSYIVATNSHAEDKWLQWDVNATTWVRIANVKCPIKEVASKYPYGAVAYNSARKEYLFGCFTKLDEQTLEIQWAGGDKTKVPANLFLIAKEQ